MVATVKVYGRQWAPMLHWLQENIGPLLHSQPIVFWHGKGWHMKREMIEPRVHGVVPTIITTVNFDTPEHATSFGLIWL